MKNKLIATIVSINITIMGLSQGSTPIVFLPKEESQNLVETGKLEPGKFYWSNPKNDTKNAPIPKKEGEITVLNISENTTLWAAYTIPKDSKSAKITVKIRRKYDEWNDTTLDDKTWSPTITRRFQKESKISAEIGIARWKNIEEGIWVTVVNTIKILPSDQLIIQLFSDSSQLDIAAVNVEFSEKPGPNGLVRQINGVEK